MEVECPVCNKSFPVDQIERHAEDCVTARFDKAREDTEDGRTSQHLSMKRKCLEPADDGEIDNCATTKAAAPPANKRSRKEQSLAWSFLQSPSNKSLAVKQKDSLDVAVGSSRGSPSHSSKESASHLQQSTHRASASSPSSPSPAGATGSGRPGRVLLAEQMRPTHLDEYVGQEAVLHQDSVLHSLLTQANFISMILWGPPGCGKTTLANIIRERCRGSERWRYCELSACSSGVQEVRVVVKEATGALRLSKKRTVLFMDEVHRFNKLQQDYFLPHVESGLLTLIGATTENPSFTLNSALLSRCRVITLEALSVSSIRKILRRSLTRLGITVVQEEDAATQAQHHTASSEDEQEENVHSNNSTVQSSVKISGEALSYLTHMSGGDARHCLNTLQALLDSHHTGLITVDQAKEALQRSHVLYDKKGDEHYNCASALQKSIRGGDDNAALYWTVRMVRGGEDPRFIARRLVRTAAEDIGLGCPEAVSHAVSTMQAVQMLGMPESDVILAQCAVYLARAAHNPEVYLAMRRVNHHLDTLPGPPPPVPLHLRNASTTLMKQLGYGRGYSCDPEKVSNITYLPEAIKHISFFQP